MSRLWQAVPVGISAMAASWLAGARPVLAQSANLDAAGALPQLPDWMSSNILVQLFQQGGILMYPILACSVVLVAVVVERLVALRRSRVIPGPFARRMLNDLRDRLLDRESALLMCRNNGSPLARVLEYAIRRWGRPIGEVQQAVAEGGQREVYELRRNLRVINGIATVAPLLGLLGTVIGMIRCFGEVATSGDAMGKPEALAGGIYVALYTTAFGLTVAIPALIAYYYFLGRVDRLVADIESIAQEVIDLVAAEPEPSAGLVRTGPDRDNGHTAPVHEPRRPTVRTAKTVHSVTRQSA